MLKLLGNSFFQIVLKVLPSVIVEHGHLSPLALSPDINLFRDTG